MYSLRLQKLISTIYLFIVGFLIGAISYLQVLLECCDFPGLLAQGYQKLLATEKQKMKFMYCTLK